MENEVGRDVVIVYVLARRKTLPSLRFTLSETRVIIFLASTEVSVKCRKMRYFGNQKKYVPKVYYFADWKRFLAEIRRTSLVANCYCASSLTQKEELYMLHKKLNTTTKLFPCARNVLRKFKTLSIPRDVRLAGQKKRFIKLMQVDVIQRHLMSAILIRNCPCMGKISDGRLPLTKSGDKNATSPVLKKMPCLVF